MMKLSTIFEQLTYGEFAQLALGGLNDGGKIAEDKQRQVANHVVLGLTALYTRFALKKNQLTLALQPDQVLYPLQSKYAVNGKFSTEPVRFILDTVARPFGDDILKIEKVIATDTGFELSLNQPEDYACLTPAMDTLQVPADMVTAGVDLPDELKTTTLTVEFRAKHPSFLPRLGYFDPERVNIELPDSHLQALLLFVASRVHTPLGMSNEFVAGNNYYAKFEAECRVLENTGLQIDRGTETTRFRRNGWA